MEKVRDYKKGRGSPLARQEVTRFLKRLLWTNFAATQLRRKGGESRAF